MDAVRRLPPDLDSAWHARRFVRRALSDGGVTGDTAWTVTLVAHELVTNAVQHARTDFLVRLDIGADAVRVEVHDDNPRQPVPATPPQLATSGRGLAVVTSLAEAWGVDADDGGKVVWATLRRRDLRAGAAPSRSRPGGRWRPRGGVDPPADGMFVPARSGGVTSSRS